MPVDPPSPTTDPFSEQTDQRQIQRELSMRMLAILAVIGTSSLAHAGVSVLKSERTVSAWIGEFESPPDVSHWSDKPGRFNESAEAHIMNEYLDHSDVKT
jgi:hypothetical protein